MHSLLLWKAGAIIPAFLITTLIALTAPAHADDDPSVTILYYEPIRLTVSPHSADKFPTAAEMTPLAFDAYGRRFELRSDEIRTLRNPNLIQLRGRLVGLADSWFSLLHIDDELSGIISDGSETYLIEPYHRVAELLVEPNTHKATANVIFRLADTLIPQGLMACATQDDTLPASEYIDGQSAVSKLGAELQAATSNALITSDLPLLVGFVADKSFVELHDTETEIEIAAVFNTVQGVISNTIGLELELDSIISVAPGDDDLFSDTVVATSLLDELGNWRFDNQPDLGHTHLLTRKILLNDTGNQLAGISYLGAPGRSGICHRKTGASLSRDIRAMTALIVTHEIGHNLGAPHDGDPDGACASTPDSEFIMSPTISRRTAADFSECSTAEIEKLIAKASCLQDTSPSLPANSDNSGGGGGGSLGLLSMAALFPGVFLRRRHAARSSRLT